MKVAVRYSSRHTRCPMGCDSFISSGRFCQHCGVPVIPHRVSVSYDVACCQPEPYHVTLDLSDPTGKAVPTLSRCPFCGARPDPAQWTAEPVLT